MKTKEEISIQFEQELNDLLDKYGAGLAVEDSARRGYDMQMVATIPSKWDENGEQLQEFNEIPLGRFFGQYIY